MSVNVETAFVQQYTTNVELLLQQRGSKIRNAVMVKNFRGKGAKAVEQIGAVAAVRRTTRHADTPLVSTPHDARWAYPKDYEWADLIDDQDRVRMLIDPQSPYALNGAYAMGRAIDAEILRACFETSATGEDGTGTESFNTTTNRVNDGSARLTVDNVREAKKILMANNVDVEMDPLFMVITAEQHQDLLEATQVISGDYFRNPGDRPVLESGMVKSFLGISIIHSEEVNTDANDDRLVPVFAKSGICLGIWDDLRTRIDERPDKSYSTQVYCALTIGACRVELGKVVQILADEA